MTDDNYFVLIDNKEFGPYTLDRLKAMWVAGQITSDTLFAQPGMTQWEPVGKKLNNTKLGVFSVVAHAPYNGPISDLVQVPSKLGEAWKTRFLFVIEEVRNAQAATGEWPADPQMHDALRAAIAHKAERGIRRMARLECDWTSGYTAHQFEIQIEVCNDAETSERHFAHATGTTYGGFAGDIPEAQWRTEANKLRGATTKIDGLGEQGVEIASESATTLYFRRRNLFCMVVQKGGKSLRQLPQYEAMVRELDKSFTR